MQNLGGGGIISGILFLSILLLVPILSKCFDNYVVKTGFDFKTTVILLPVNHIKVVLSFNYPLLRQASLSLTSSCPNIMLSISLGKSYNYSITTVLIVLLAGMLRTVDRLAFNVLPSKKSLQIDFKTFHGLFDAKQFWSCYATTLYFKQIGTCNVSSKPRAL